MEDQPSSAVELLQALVRIPSVNPDGDTQADPRNTGEQACAEYVGGFLRTCGADVVLEEIEPGRPNVYGRFPSAPGSKPRILFAPHTDTVSVSGMTIDPFGGELRDGRVWGRGASDTKGTMAAMLWMFWELRDVIPTLGAEVGFVGLMGEETGQPGSKHFAANHGSEWDFAIVGEPTGLDIVNTHKACHWVELTATGVAAHGSTPERGENAIMKMLRVLNLADGELREKLAGYTHPVLGHSTVNIGTIEGGNRTNIIPDRCVATLDFRETPSLHEAGGAVKLFQNLLNERGMGDLVSLRVTVESAPLNTGPENSEVKRLESLGAKCVGAPWFCDAAWLAEGGIPAVAIGPGTIAQAHTVDEHLAVADLEGGVDFYRKFLETFQP